MVFAMHNPIVSACPTPGIMGACSQVGWEEEEDGAHFIPASGTGDWKLCGFHSPNTLCPRSPQFSSTRRK
jgi:hypothetical protein